MSAAVISGADVTPVFEPSERASAAGANRVPLGVQAALGEGKAWICWSFLTAAICRSSNCVKHRPRHRSAARIKAPNMRLSPGFSPKPWGMISAAAFSSPNSRSRRFVVLANDRQAQVRDAGPRNRPRNRRARLAQRWRSRRGCRPPIDARSRRARRGWHRACRPNSSDRSNKASNGAACPSARRTMGSQC